jgi:uncharacterized protein (DUF1501 family)
VKHHTSTCSCSRRSFLKGCGVSLAGFGVASLFPTPLLSHVMGSATNSERRLLFIFLRGGNDGINAVIPHGDITGYSAATRPTLYIPPGEAINLNDFASLHPSLHYMTDAFDAGELAVLHRIGYPNNSQSHFDGQRIWENGDPAQAQLFQGWLYRYIRDNILASGVDLPALSVQALSPILLKGEETFVNISNPNNFDYVIGEPTSTKFSNSWKGVYQKLVGLEQYRPLLSQTGVKLVDTLDTYESWDQANWNPKDPDNGWSLFPVDPASNQAGFNSAAFGFFASLKVSALSLLESNSATNNNGTRVAGTQLSGWDLHDNQGQMNGAHAQLLEWLAYGFRSLRIVFSGAAVEDVNPRNYPSIWDDTLVVTLSEFGRTSLENGNGGTDHASASCQFLSGGTVNGGVYNCDSSTWPAGVTTAVNGRYLLYRTDYRSVFWEILRDHMGADPQTVNTMFPNYTSLGLPGHELGLISG